MPRKKNPLDLTSGLRNVQWQARALLTKHRIDIRKKETQLKRLKAQESGLARMAGGAGPRGGWRSRAAYTKESDRPAAGEHPVNQSLDDSRPA